MSRRSPTDYIARIQRKSIRPVMDCSFFITFFFHLLPSLYSQIIFLFLVSLSSCFSFLLAPFLLFIYFLCSFLPFFFFSLFCFYQLLSFLPFFLIPVRFFFLFQTFSFRFSFHIYLSFFLSFFLCYLLYCNHLNVFPFDFLFFFFCIVDLSFFNIIPDFICPTKYFLSLNNP